MFLNFFISFGHKTYLLSISDWFSQSKSIQKYCQPVTGTNVLILIKKQMVDFLIKPDFNFYNTVEVLQIFQIW